MNILALDLATKCGWAVGSDDHPRPKHGTVDLVNKQFDGAGMRYLKFHGWLLNMIKQHNVDIVVYEGVVSHTGVIASHLYGGWMSTMQIVCEANHVRYTAFGVSEIKKFWTGKGNAKKDAMIKAANKRGFDPKDDNAADALAVWFLGKETYGDL